MGKDTIQDAYKLLIEQPGKDKDDNKILEHLADWLCHYLKDDQDKIFYFSLPIWNYVHNNWDSSFPVCISKINDSSFGNTSNDWYKTNDGNKGVPEGTYFNKFYKESLNNQSFSFVEFITQDSTVIKPIFTIEYINDGNGIDYNLNIEKGFLKLYNSSETPDNCNIFLSRTFNLLSEKANTIDALNDEQIKKIKALFSFLSNYQKHFPGIKYIYLITSRIFMNGAYSLNSGGMILVCNEQLDSDKLYLMSCLVNLCYREKGGKNWEEKCRIESIKSAKAAIMSRNMSHNLGSHVMAYLKQKMGSVASIMSADNNVLKYLDLSNGTRGDVELPFLVGLGRFIGYIQERQDYIATIATDYIPYGAPVNMKDAIYDELNPDLRYMRHKSDEKNRPMNILLSYIAKSEGLSRENMDQRDKKPDDNNPGSFINNIDKFKTNHDILFGFISYSQSSEGIHKEIFGLTQSKCNSDNNALDKMRGINFSLPGGLIGRQALFSVIENIIRNAAKHGDLQSLPDGNLCFTFDVLDCNKLDENDADHELELETRICDPIWRKLYQAAPDKKMMYLLTITDNIDYSKNPDVAKKLISGGLVEPYIDISTGRMTETNKGIKEIRISSAWLRREPNEDLYERYPINNIETEPVIDSTKTLVNKRMPLVAVELTRDNHLRYIIALRKNRIVAVIADELKDSDIFREIESNSPIDWCVFDSVDQFKRENQDNFRYIIVANKNVFNDLRPFVSNRILIWNELSQERDIFNDITSLEDRIKRGEDSSDLQLNKTLKERRDELTKSVLSHIYRTFTGLSENGPTFFICDDAPSITEHIQFRKIKQVGEATIIEVEEINDKGQSIKVNKNVSDVAEYVYRTHHATKKDYESYWIKKNGLDKENPGKTYENIIAIDGITGDNSSDRLVRREPLNEEWYFSHLYAMQQKVAIIDERIFKIVHNVDETQFVSASIPGLAQILDKLERKTIDKDIALQRITKLAKGKIDTSFIPELVNDDITTICSKLNKYNTSKFDRITKHGNHLSQYYSERGVDIFSVIRDENGNFAIIGCVKCRCNGIHDLFECTFDKIATLSWNNNSIEIDYNEQYIKQFHNKFNYISIHQGILDKIYEGFNIKEYNGGQNDVYKEKVTSAIHNLFMKDPDVIPIIIDNNKKEFLPRFIIHSGRSKPTKIDMPQHLPFVQYAALEHSVKDCKFSLIEVLDFAQIEGEA